MARQKWHNLSPAEEQQKIRQPNYRARRGLLILHRGGECVQCGLKYNETNGPVFAFHHRDPGKKLFELSLNNMGKPLRMLIEEADKCDLHCQNCHQLNHSKLY